VTAITRALFSEAERRYKQGYEEVSRALDHLLVDAVEDLKAGGSEQDYLLANNTAVALRSTVGNAHALLSIVLAGARESEAEAEPPAPEKVRCSNCTRKVPPADAYRVRFEDAEGDVILCRACYDTATADGRKVVHVGTCKGETTPVKEPTPEGEALTPDFTSPEKPDDDRDLNVKQKLCGACGKPFPLSKLFDFLYRDGESKKLCRTCIENSWKKGNEVKKGVYLAPAKPAHTEEAGDA
jgi:hypothetical protein